MMSSWAFIARKDKSVCGDEDSKDSLILLDAHADGYFMLKLVQMKNICVTIDMFALLHWSDHSKIS